MYDFEPGVRNTTIAPQFLDQILGSDPVLGMTAKECHNQLMFLI